MSHGRQRQGNCARFIALIVARESHCRNLCRTRLLSILATKLADIPVRATNGALPIGVGIMRDQIEGELPDTEPYQEILAVMGSIIAVVVGLTVLLSQGVLS